MDRQINPMTTERWMQLKEMFAAVRGKPPAEQAEMICVLVQGDEELESARALPTVTTLGEVIATME
jgi:hypothetical protein